MKPALKVRIGELQVTAGDGVIEVNIGNNSVMLNDDDVQALTRTLLVADHLVEHGY